MPGAVAAGRVSAWTPVAPLPASSPKRTAGINGRTSDPPATSSPEVCSFRLLMTIRAYRRASPIAAPVPRPARVPVSIHSRTFLTTAGWRIGPLTASTGFAAWHLADDQPAAEHADRGEVLLHRRDRPGGRRMYPRGVKAPHGLEAETPALAPPEKLPRGPRLRRPRPLVRAPPRAERRSRRACPTPLRQARQLPAEGLAGQLHADTRSAGHSGARRPRVLGVPLPARRLR